MAKYKFYWLDKTTNEGEGESPEDALTKLGFGQGAISALDYWEEIQMDKHCRNCKQLQAHTCPIGKDVSRLNSVVWNSNLFEIDHGSSAELVAGETMMGVMKSLGENCKVFVEGEKWV